MIEQIASFLSATLDPKGRKQAEQQLAQIEKQPGFAPILLQLISDGNCDYNVRFAASVYFKNYVKRAWTVDSEDLISPQDREGIKQVIVNLMISVPTNMQLQLSDSISCIADTDFPQNWTSLLGDLVSKLSVTDLQVNIGVLQTAHSIFKRWRSQFENNTLFTEINYVMKEFSPAYLQFYQAIDSLVDQNANNPQVAVLLETVLLLNKIYFSLNCQDLPEFFEDNMTVFMAFFQKYLEYKNPNVQTDDEASVVEKIKSVICEILILYGDKYESDFKALPQFVQNVWTLLINTGIEPKNDILVSKAIAFLTSVVKHERHKALFEAPDTLNSICSRIILPNMYLRESDEELFEDDPIEYIRRDLEGSDSDTRRRASADLVRGLMKLFEKTVTEIFSAHIQECLANYQKDPATNWKAKDTALFLITSLSAKTITAQAGATSINEFIQILPVFAEHVNPDLVAAVDGQVHPIIKVDAIKYLMLFRSQLNKQQLLQVLPILANHLGSSNYVVNTWTAHCIERILAMKEGAVPMFSGVDIEAITQPTLQRLFEIIQRGKTPEKLAENDYLIKCILRIIVTTKESLLNHVTLVLERLTFIIGQISKNPSNPKFNHYAFESLSALVKYVCVQQPSLVTSFESSLFGPIQEILALDVVEFTPYCFQILSQMLSLHSDGIPDAYMHILGPLLQPAAWESHANIPALVNLLNAFLAKGSANLIRNGQVAAFLGIASKLLSSRMNDHHGFNLFKSIFEHIPTADLSQYVKNVFVLLLTRIFQSKTPKFTRCFLDFMCFLFLLDKPGVTIDNYISIIDSIQQNPLFGGLLESILIPEVELVSAPQARKNTAIALVKLLTQSEAMVNQYFSLWSKLLVAILNLFQLPAHTVTAEETDLVADLEEAGYQPSYSRLASGAVKKQDLNIDPETYLCTSLIALGQKQPKISQAIQTELPQDKSQGLMARLQNGGASLIR
ncbi:importin-alpha export receptor [Terramyces sp. JEL0728]|nr:importin-alpha export receptor [Terramyces sp. JEL0728]